MRWLAEDAQYPVEEAIEQPATVTVTVTATATSSGWVA
jgi:hypothetical protein